MRSLWKLSIKGCRKVLCPPPLGIYPKLPSSYSDDLAALIKALLQTSPKKRPSCAEILELSFVRRRVQDLRIQQDSQLASLGKAELLGTIQLPRNLKILHEKLPKPHYKTYVSLYQLPRKEQDESDLPKMHPSKSSKGSGVRQLLQEESSRALSSSVDKKQAMALKLKAALNDQTDPLSRRDLQETKEARVQKEQREARELKELQVQREHKERRLPMEAIEESSKYAEIGLKLPEIRQRVAPIRRPPPRVHPHGSNEELIRLYLQGGKNPSSHPHRMRRYHRVAERMHRVRRMPEGPELPKPIAYYLYPYADKERGRPAPNQHMYNNAYNLYK